MASTAASAHTKAAPATAASTSLSDEQLQALFHILVHNETYAEIAAFRDPIAIATAGYPFAFDDDIPTTNRDADTPADVPQPDRPSSDPLLQMLSVKFVMPIPGLSSVPATFWSRCVQGVVSKFGKAKLSESYDQGAIGSRRTLSTAASAVIEAFARGYLGGLRKVTSHDKAPGKNEKTEEEKHSILLARDWNKFIEDVVYGDFIDRACDVFEKTADIEKEIPVVEGAIEYGIILLATFLHRAFIVSPEGPYVIELLGTANGLVPYSIIRQTLKVGNAATMISAIARLLLSKLSIGSVSNWLGFTQKADEGMNLLQRIISTVMLWDSGQAKRIIADVTHLAQTKNTYGEWVWREQEEDNQVIKRHQIEAINEFMDNYSTLNDEVRQLSQDESISIIQAILKRVDYEFSNAELSQEANDLLIRLYGAKLMIRDREEIVSILCNQNPDIVTEAVRDAINAYDPVIRDLHARIDLTRHVSAIESFVSDFLATSNTKKKTKAVTVQDYVDLLMKHRQSLYNWLHDAIRECENVKKIYRDYLKMIVVDFRQGRTGDLQVSNVYDQVRNLFDGLQDQDKKKVLHVLDDYVKYLVHISNPSYQEVDLAGKSSDEILDLIGGPATYMAGWQALVDKSKITPTTPHGPLRCGRDVYLKPMSRRSRVVVDGDGSSTSKTTSRKGSSSPTTLQMGNPTLSFPLEPDTTRIEELLGGKFKKYLQDEALRTVKPVTAQKI